MRRHIRIIGFAAALMTLSAIAARPQQLILVKPAAGADQMAHPAPPACASLAGSLKQPAQTVWLRLCAGEAIDLTKITGAGNGIFLDEIIADPSRQAMLKDARIRIANGTLDALTMHGLEARSLTLTSVTIHNDLTIYDSAVSDGVTLENVQIGGGIDIENLTTGRFRQSSSGLKNSLCVLDSHIDSFSVNKSDDPNLGIFTSQVGSVDISNIGNSNLILWSARGQDVDILNSGKLRVSLSDSALTGNIRLLNDLWQAGNAPVPPRICGRPWQDKAPVVLSYVQAQEFVLFSGFAGFSPPPLGVEHAKFDTVSFGPDPLPAIAGIGALSDREQSLEGPQYLPFLAAAARNYAANGRADAAREITYKINLLNKPPITGLSDIWDSAIWWLRRISVGFGQRVQWGIYWIIGLVVIGWWIFRSGRKDLVDPKTRPDNWMLFAIDTVIPVIHLDRRHADVAFTGWRQWYLSFLRVMGAILVFLVFYFLQQVLLGNG